jgi:hypothetical protein
MKHTSVWAEGRGKRAGQAYPNFNLRFVVSINVWLTPHRPFIRSTLNDATPKTTKLPK